MPPMTPLFAALALLAALAGCGTKTPLALPPQPQEPAKATALPSPMHTTQALALAGDRRDANVRAHQ